MTKGIVGGFYVFLFVMQRTEVKTKGCFEGEKA